LVGLPNFGHGQNFGNSLDGCQIFGIAHTTLPTLVCFSCQHLPNNGQAKPKFYLPKFLVG
jgi:hypothetical protein